MSAMSARFAQPSPAATDTVVVVAEPAQIRNVDDALALITGKLSGWLEGAIAMLPNLLVAVLIAVAFWLGARVVRNVLGRVLQRTGLHEPIRDLLTGAVGFAVVATGCFVALGVLGLDKTVTSLLAGVGILGLVLGFAFQDLAANFMAGIILSIRKPFQVGQIVKTNDYTGTVTEINLRDTVVQLFTGQIVRIPNKEVFNNAIINYSETGERRVDLTVGVSYGEDLEQVSRVATAAVQELEACRDDRPVSVYYQEFGDSSINFSVRFWVDFVRQPDYMIARSDAVMAIKRAFDREGIMIPFPIRTLDFAIKGGEPLADALRPVLGEQKA